MKQREPSRRGAAKLSLPQASQNERLVDKHPFLAEKFQVLDSFGAQLGVCFPRPFPPANRTSLDQGPLPGHIQQVDQFVFGHGPALSPAVGLLVRLRDFGDRITYQSIRVHAPVADGDQGAAVGVARLCCRVLLGHARQPTLKPFTGDVREPRQSAFRMGCISHHVHCFRGPFLLWSGSKSQLFDFAFEAHSFVMAFPIASPMR